MVRHRPSRVGPIRVLCTCGLLAVVSACDEPSNPTQPPSEEDSPRPADLRAERVVTLDDEFERIARDEVPGFAGYYLDDEGRSVVLLVDPTQRAVAARVVVAAYRARVGLPAAPAIIRAARYDFIQLKRWRDVAIPLTRGDGVFTLDIDEVANKVRVGVQDMAKAAELQSALLAAGIPASAVTVKVEPRPEYRQSLQGQHRPVHAGYQVQGSGRPPCTLTVNAGGSGENFTSFFFTASHCTGIKFGMDYLAEYQPVNTSEANLIGWEYQDVQPYWCPQYGMTCRYSDAALFGIPVGPQYAWARIARPTNYAIGQAGTLLVDTANAFVIASDLDGDEVVGWWMDKVGRTSGWTRGQVQQTCVIIAQLVCQYVGSIWSQGGDSGSPILRTNISGPDPGTVGNVNFSGILWGGPQGDFTTTYWSPASGIRHDFGSVHVCAGPSCSN